MAYTAIDNSSLFMNPVLYTGNTTAPRTISGVGFQPDLNWTKGRSAVSSNWFVDALRGGGKTLRSDNPDAELTNPSGGYLSSFNSDGYVLTEGSSSDVNYNSDTETYVSWNWIANGSGSANTDGSISSTVSANTTSRFSIVSYTGTGSNATVGHGLGVAPSLIIIKYLGSGGWAWRVGSTSVGWTKRLFLNTTDAEGTDASAWNDTAPTSSVFSVGTSTGTNGSSAGLIAYCFADVAGYSKIGSYTGNGNADGTFVYTGFRPSFILLKSSSAVTAWYIFDNKRLGYNGDNKSLRPNSTATESTASAYPLDILSNGFKPRSTNNEVNGSGDTYVYMAFAEAPFVNSEGVPCNAR